MKITASIYAIITTGVGGIVVSFFTVVDPGILIGSLIGALYAMVRLKEVSTAEAFTALLFSTAIGIGVADGLLVQVMKASTGLLPFLVAVTAASLAQSLINKLHEQIGLLNFADHLMSWLPKRKDADDGNL